MKVIDAISYATPPPWPLQIRRRFATLWLLKASGTATFTALFFWAYFSVLEHPQRPVLEVPLTWLDAQIPFTPGAYGVYLSLWLYVALPPALIGNIKSLMRYGAWITALCALGLTVFWVFPNKTPFFDVDWRLYPALARIKNIDASGNACPSLHVATAVFSAWWLEAVLTATSVPRLFRVANLLVCLAIIWSTIAIRQHVVIDALAGALLGLVLGWLSMRGHRASV